MICFDASVPQLIPLMKNLLRIRTHTATVFALRGMRPVFETMYRYSDFVDFQLWSVEIPDDCIKRNFILPLRCRFIASEKFCGNNENFGYWWRWPAFPGFIEQLWLWHLGKVVLQLWIVKIIIIYCYRKS